MNNFQKNELKGRELFKAMMSQSNSVKNLEFSKGEYDSVDAIMNYKGKDTVVEIKCRNSAARKYDTLLMEEGKYKAMKEYMDKGYRGWYVHFIEDNECYIHRLNDLEELEFSERMMPRTTAGDSTLVPKSMAEIPKSEAAHFVRNNDRWKYIK